MATIKQKSRAQQRKEGALIVVAVIAATVIYLTGVDVAALIDRILG